MAEEIAKLGIAIDASEVTPAASKLDTLTAAGAKAEVQTDRVTVSAKQLATALAATGNDLVKATALLDAQARAATTAATATAQAATVETVANKAAATAAVEGVGVQIAANEALKASHDINSRAITESLVLLREAVRGNYSRMAGSASILAQATGLLTAAGILAAAPFVALAAVVGIFGLAMERGSEEAAKLNNAISSTGNYAGITASSFEAMSKRISAATDISERSAGKLITSLVATGKFSADTIELMVTAAAHFAAVTGESADSIVKGYESMKGGVVKWAVAHEESYHDLTLAQIDYIANLERQGHHEQAEFALMQDITNHIKTVAVPQYGYLQTALHGVENAASSMWDALLHLGKPDTLQEQMDQVTKRIEAAQKDLADRAKQGDIDPYAVEKATKLNDLLKKQGDLHYAIRIEIEKTTAASKLAQEEDDKIRQKYDDEAKKLPVDENQKKIDRATATLNVEKLVLAQQLDLNAAVEAGTMTSAQATIEIEKTANARRIEGIAEGTSGKTKTALLAIAKELIAVDEASGRAKAAAQLDKDNETAEAQNKLLAVQVSLIGQSNVDQATAIALLKEKQKLSAAGNYDPANPTAAQQKALDLAKANAIATVDLADKTKAFNDQLSLQKDLYGELDSAAQAAASHMGDAFGNVGSAFAAMSTALTSYAAKQADFAAQQEKLNKAGNTDAAAQILLDQKRADASTEYYASEVDGLKNMFGKKTAIYAALNAAEQIYNSIQLVNSLARVSASIFETGVKTAGVTTVAGAQVTGAAVETGTTAVSVTNAATQASAWGVTAIAKAIASLPFPFDLLAGAAVAAALIGFGVSVLGGGGSGPSAADIAANDPANSKNVQATQGTGSVLGDATAKSDSIQKSLDTLAKNTNADLDYSNQMVFSLRSIDAHIGSLTSLLAQQVQVGGAFDTSGLKLGANSSGVGSGIPLVGGLISSLLGSTKTTNTLLDQGLQVQATTVGKAIADGIVANSYQTVQSTKQSSALFGLISSTKTSNSTTTSALGSEFTDQVSAIIGGLRSTVLQAATKLGIDGAQSVVDSFAVNIGKISLNGLKGSEIQDELSAVFGKLGDDLANTAIPNLRQFQQVGEGAFATLTRLVSEYQVVDDAQKIIGFSFSQVGLEGIAARDSLVQLSGGLDNFQSQASAFAQNFLTDGQQLAPVAQAVAAAMSSLGFAGVSTKAQFVSLVQGLDLSTDSGAALYTQLMSIAPAFAKVADAATDLANQRGDLEIKLLQDQGNAINATALQREKELDALDASLRPLQAAIYAQEDLNAANDAATKAATDLANATNAAATAQTNVLSAQKAVEAANDKVSAAQVALNKLLNPQVDTVQALSNAHTRLASAYGAESSALQNTISQFGGFASSLKSFSATLNGSASSDPLSVYATARIAFQQLNALPANDATRLANLQNVGQNFISASQAASATGLQYQSDVAAVRSAVDQSAAAAQATADNATLQLSALNDSVAGLGVLNDSVLSVKDAIRILSDAQIADNAYQGQVKDAEIAKAKSELADAQQAQADAIVALAGKIASMDAANQQIAISSKKVADLLLRVTQDGDYLLTKVAA